jgi:hypothetical protein
LLGLSLCLAGCSSTPREAQEAVLAALPDKRGVSYEQLRRYPKGVVCGYYTAQDVMSARMLRRPFVYREGWVSLQPSEEQQQIFCAQNQAQALYQQLGIGSAAGPPPPEVLQVRADLKATAAAIEAFREARRGLPRDAAELERERAARGDAGWAWPRDPWGAPYRYEPGMGGRVRANYRLLTLGADGQPGGAGPDADIGIGQLRYLELLSAEQ